jgi:hypothetical protein
LIEARPSWVRITVINDTPGFLGPSLIMPPPNAQPASG